MAGFLGDDEVLGRILDHISAGTTDRGDEVWREPVSNYTSEARLAHEIEAVLKPALAPFCPSAALPEVGSFVTRESFGVPVLVARDREGRVRGFKNACRHRGAQVACGAGSARAFVCPYHGWAYGLDGKLRSIPHRDGFPQLDRSEHSLVPVRTEEKLGLVFLSLAPEPPRIEGTEELPPLVAQEQRLIDETDYVVSANWKTFLEGFIEGYHIRFAHRDTFYPFGYDNLTLVERCGAHSRVTYPFRRIERLASRSPKDRSVDGRLTYVYHLFPNALVTVLSRHTNVLVLEPLDLQRTRVFAYQLTNRGEGATDGEAASRDSSFVTRTGAAEDLELVQSVQRSLGSGANEVFTFGHYEAAIAHFHRNLTKALKSPAAGR